MTSPAIAATTWGKRLVRPTAAVIPSATVRAEPPPPPGKEDPLLAYRFQRARIGVQATLFVLVIVAVMLLAFSPGRSDIPAVPLLALLAAAVVGAGVVAFIPWERLHNSRVGLWCFYAWSIFDVLLVTLAISVTGAGRSELFILYGLTTILFVVSYPPKGQAVLLAFTAGSYIAVLGAAGWEISTAALLLRLCFLGTLAFLGNFLSGELTRLLSQQYDVMNKLTELDDLRSDFLSTVSHELRTPLTTIGGLAVTLRKHGQRLDDEVRKDLLGRIEANSRDLDELISQLLDFSRAEQGQLRVKPRLCDIGTAVREAVAKLDRVLGTHEVRVDVPQGVVAMADPVACDRILHNLLTNAAKFSAPGTAITIRALEQGENVVVLVEDEGIGISSEEQERIFERFYRVERGDQAKEGTGIGLAIVKQFAEAQGGDAWVRSEPGRGSVFGFTLP